MNMGFDLALLATEKKHQPRDPHLWTIQAKQTGLREASKKHRSQDKKNHAGGQTDHGRVPEEQEGGEIQKTHHKEEAPRGIETRLRNGEETISETEGLDCWRDKKWQKS